MGSYIAAAQKNIRAIMEKIIAFEKVDARFGLVAYRDHPPQDSTFVTKTFDFTSSRRDMQAHVDWMSAQGGGDGPEAVAAGLKAAVDMCWRKESAKIIILIADAPPHGLGESGDGFPDGCPDGNDPLQLAHAMKDLGIVCYPVGCEPALGGYRFARDFLVSLATISQGQAVTLSSAALLADVIIGGAVEEIALERIMESVDREIEEEQAAAAAAGGAELNDEELCLRVQSKLAARGTKVRSMKHDAVLSAPHAKTMAGKKSLKLWRDEAPRPSLDEECSFSFRSEVPLSKSYKRKKSKAPLFRASRRSSSPSLAVDDLEAVAPPSKVATTSTSKGATTTWMEDDVISLEQVMRIQTKSRARKGKSMF